MTTGSVLDAPRVGRDGTLSLRFARRGPATVVAGSRYTLPLQVLAPIALDGPAAVVSMLNPTGGLVGGDRLSIDVHAAEGAHAVLTTPSATRVYRTQGEETIQVVRLRVGPGAALEWVPDHTIPYARSALRQTITADLDETARLILVDAFSAGRIALGEAWRFTTLDSAISIRDPRGFILYDRFVLRGRDPDHPAFDGLGFTDSRPYFASIAIVGEFDRDRFAADIDRLATDSHAARLGAAVLPRRGVLVRVLAPTAPALVDAMEACWCLARRTLFGLPTLALRKG